MQWGAVSGVWLRSPQPEAIRGLGAERQAAGKFCIFLQNRLNFRPILIKIIALKRGIWSLQCKNLMKLIAEMGYVEDGYKR